MGVPLALFAMVALLYTAWQRRDLTQALVFGLYALTMLGTYLSSTIYHALPHHLIKRRNRFHLFDHISIYLFIAGTYTPVALYSLPPLWSAWILSGVWLLAIAGTLFKLRYLGRYPKVSLVFYLLMGWLVVVAIKPLLETAPTGLLYWILAGGVAYSIGTVFFSWRSLPYGHAVWHLFVLAGSFCHFMGIYLYL